MQIMYTRCAGLDVHRDSVQVCVQTVDEQGQVHKQIRRYGTMTGGLVELCTWLEREGVTHVAMESTGVYWKPIWNVLEGRFTLLLANARHIKQVPGRKTDVKDCQWIAQLLGHGLLSGSLVPDRHQRQMRDLTRHRVQLLADHTRVANRIDKVLQDANIKLGSVASDVLGVSGRAIIGALIDGETDAAKMAELAKASLRSKRDELAQALQGRVTEHHRWMLRLLMTQLKMLEAQLKQIEERIAQLLTPFEREAIALLDPVPGLNWLTAVTVVAEIGTDMSRFPTHAHLCSWSGICPGNNQSGGKRRSGRTPPGNRWLRRILVQAALAAKNKKGSYFGPHYRRLARRRGPRRAALAVGHTLLVTTYHILKDRKPYEDLGHHYLDRVEPQRLANHLVKRLKSLGYHVTIDRQAA